MGGDVSAIASQAQREQRMLVILFVLTCAALASAWTGQRSILLPGDNLPIAMSATNSGLSDGRNGIASRHGRPRVSDRGTFLASGESALPSSDNALGNSPSSNPARRSIAAGRNISSLAAPDGNTPALPAVSRSLGNGNEALPVLAQTSRGGGNGAVTPPTLAIGGGEVPRPIVAVPEPGMWLLMIAGFALIGTRLRRNRVAKSSVTR